MGRRDTADLAMLADGTLPRARRAEVEARIAASPEGSELLANERRAVEAVRAVASVPAPASLRERIAADRHDRRTAGSDRRTVGRAARRRGAVLGSALAGAVAVLAVALVLVLSGGNTSPPSVGQAASIALRGSSSLAPPTRIADPAKLSRNVDDVYFPNWAGIGWTADGQRVDTVDGRVTRTIYYRDRDGTMIAYTIVAGPALAEPSGATLSTRHGVQLRSIVLGGRRVVTWRRDGHTCILSGPRVVPDSVLRGLASRDPTV